MIIVDTLQNLGWLMSEGLVHLKFLEKLNTGEGLFQLFSDQEKKQKQKKTKQKALKDF